jgi:hypothetical protein
LNRQYKSRQIPAGKPLANLLVLVVGAVTIALSLVIGFIAFVALAGMVIILAVVMGMRSWWLQRYPRPRPTPSDNVEPTAAGPKAVIEGEFKVIDTKNRRDSTA